MKSNQRHLSPIVFCLLTQLFFSSNETLFQSSYAYGDPTTTNLSSTSTLKSKYSSPLLLQQNYCIASFLPTYLQKSSSTKSSETLSFSSSSSSSTTTTTTTSMKAWTCHGRTHREMIDRLASAGIIQSSLVKEALLRVDRIHYVTNHEYAYMDAPQQIGHGQTISAPHMHAHVLEELVPSLIQLSKEIENTTQDETTKSTNLSTDTRSKGLKILDVGCGSGYLTAALGRLVDGGLSTSTPSSTSFTNTLFGRASSSQVSLSQGKVYGIDVYPELVDLSRENIKKADQDLLTSGTVILQVGDGWKGLKDIAPFHAIHVGAAAETFPKNLMMQLYPHGGTMVVPIGPEGGYQSLYRVERLRDSDTFDERDFRIRSLLGVRYVPLIHP